MKKLSLKKLNRPKTPEGVRRAIENEGFTPFDEAQVGITLMTVFKGKERHTCRCKKDGGLRVKLQSYTACEGAEDKIFLAMSCDSADSRKKCRHLSCDIFVKSAGSHNKKDLY